MDLSTHAKGAREKWPGKKDCSPSPHPVFSSNRATYHALCLNLEQHCFFQRNQIACGKSQILFCRFSGINVSSAYFNVMYCKDFVDLVMKNSIIISLVLHQFSGTSELRHMQFHKPLGAIYSIS